MTRLPTLAALFCLTALPVAGGAIDALPAARHDPAVTRPADFFEHAIGEWHVRHDRLIAYLSELAETSERVQLERIGTTHERRPLVLAAISSPANLARLDELREAHLRGDAEAPLVVWLGYSVHGNEASGTNAAPLVAWHLAAADGEVEAWLEDTIVLLDPCLNPDGYARFSQWVNAHRSQRPLTDRAHREHTEGWPNGRTNHYWFDLNRDWLPLVHPESRARLGAFNRWQPHVLTDFHEMGSDSTYFFQPGIPTRKNPLTPDANVTLTAAIARFHAEALDARGTLYYTEESFDDFYYGKGSTYPDVNGSIGILFEQASVRGHAVDTVNGRMTFGDAVGNQVTTSLSTLRGADAHRAALKKFRRDFYRDAKAEGRGAGGYLVRRGEDRSRLAAFVDLLLAHRIEVRPAGDDWVVSLDQPQSRLVRALFERPREFLDDSFYDVSAWTLPLAFDIDHERLPAGALARLKPGEPLTSAPTVSGGVSGRSDVGYLLDWKDSSGAVALARLFEAGVRARVVTRPVRLEDGSTFEPGTIAIPAGGDGVSLHATLERVAEATGARFTPMRSGLTPGGPDLGSPSLVPLKAPRPALVVGSGVSTYEAGEIWHLLDRRLGLPLTLVENDRVGRLDLDDYTHLILVSGRYDWSDETLEGLKRWLGKGGVLLATRSAVGWVARKELAGIALAEEDDEQRAEEDAEASLPPAGDRPYAERRRDAARDRIAGAIFEIELDRTHPLAYGYPRAATAAFRNSTLRLAPAADAYSTVARYAAEPLLAGYTSEVNRSRLAGTPALVVGGQGRGRVVAFADPPDFRGFWRATNRLFWNALYFGSIVEVPRGED